MKTCKLYENMQVKEFEKHFKLHNAVFMKTCMRHKNLTNTLNCIMHKIRITF